MIFFCSRYYYSRKFGETSRFFPIIMITNVIFRIIRPNVIKIVRQAPTGALHCQLGFQSWSFYNEHRWKTVFTMERLQRECQLSLWRIETRQRVHWCDLGLWGWPAGRGSQGGSHCLKPLPCLDVIQEVFRYPLFT